MFLKRKFIKVITNNFSTLTGFFDVFSFLSPKEKRPQRYCEFIFERSQFQFFVMARCLLLNVTIYRKGRTAPVRVHVYVCDKRR